MSNVVLVKSKSGFNLSKFIPTHHHDTPPPSTPTKRLNKVTSIINQFESTSKVGSPSKYQYQNKNQIAPASPSRNSNNTTISPTVPASFFQQSAKKRQQSNNTGTATGLLLFPSVETKSTPTTPVALSVIPPYRSRAHGRAQDDKENTRDDNSVKTSRRSKYEYEQDEDVEERSSLESHTTTETALYAVVSEARRVDPVIERTMVSKPQRIYSPSPSTSHFIEALTLAPSHQERHDLPPDLPPRDHVVARTIGGGSLEYAPKPISKSGETSRGGGVRKRANTVEGGVLRPSMLSDEVVESVEEKEMRVSIAFEKLLDTMQLPTKIVRDQMLHIAFPLKEEMLRASLASTSSSLSPVKDSSTRRSRPRSFTHSRGQSLHLFSTKPTSSSSSLKSPSSSIFSFSSSSDLTLTSAPTKDTTKRHSRSSSATAILSKVFSRSNSASSLATTSASVKGKGNDMNCKSRTRGDDEAAWWAVRLRSSKCRDLTVKEVGKLRGRLRGETTAWVEEFLRCGGYVGMLERLKELLEVEWREEQHDDQILHELLRCFKALTLTPCGRTALASQRMTPFVPLAALLFSEKRPGDLPCRQLLVELIGALFEVCPDSIESELPLSHEDWSKPVTINGMGATKQSNVVTPTDGTNRRYIRQTKGGDGEEEDAETIEKRTRRAHEFVNALMVGPSSSKEQELVGFILQARKPRMYKVWVKEIADIVRDFFWIFCHTSNLFWSLEQIDAGQIESPKVPSGMTGGVECEAMAYCTEHLRLINAVASTCESPEAAFRFHLALFQSGFEQVILHLRRASLVYYGTLHLELSRYISLARSARFNLGPIILQRLDQGTLSRAEQAVVQAEKDRVAVKQMMQSPALPELSFDRM